MKGFLRIILIVVPLLLMVGMALPQGSSDPAQFTFTVENDAGAVTVVAPAGYILQDEEQRIIAHPGGSDTLRIDVYEAGTTALDAITASGGEGLELNTVRLQTGVPWSTARADDTVYAAIEASAGTYVLVGTVDNAEQLTIYGNTTFMVFLLTFTEGDTVDSFGLTIAQSILNLLPPAIPPSENSIVRTLDFTPFEAALDDFDANRLEAVHEIAFETNLQDLQHHLDHGDLTSVELVLYYLSRIRRYDVDQLRSVLELNPEALDIAQMLDDERASGHWRGPLHGIPVLLKDNIGTGDMLHTTAGAAALMDAHSDRDAFLVTKLREAGAIILGKTNLSEWANFISSRLPNGFSALGGQVMNPYGESFDPFGSSTGSAVSVSANFATLAVGTETMGSVISPSVANSVVGMYPSVGLISRDRIIPISEYMDTAGPIARNVHDLSLLLTAMAGVDVNDPRTLDAAELEGTDFFAYLDEYGLQGKRVVVLTRGGMDPENFIQLFFTQDVADAFANAGAELVFASESFGEASVLPVFIYGMQTGVDAYLAETNAPVSTVADIVALNEENADLYVPYGQDLLRRVARNSYTSEEIAEIAERNRSTAREFLRGLLVDYDADVIVALDYEIAGAYAPAGFPAITVPGGYRRNGQPFGITFVGDYLSDGLLISYAYAFEQASHFRVPPPIGSD